MRVRKTGLLLGVAAVALLLPPPAFATRIDADSAGTGGPKAGPGTAPGTVQWTAPGVKPRVGPRVETPPLYDDDAGGSADADDPAIWVDGEDPADSLVISTAKNGGLYAYDLGGRVVQHVPAPAAPGAGDESGRFNNVDLLYGIGRSGGAGRRDLAVVSDRGRDQLRIYAIDHGRGGRTEHRRGGPLTDVTAPGVPFVFSADQAAVNEQRTAYGLAAWHDRRTGAAYVVVSRRNTTRIALLRLIPAAGGTIGYRVVRTLDLPSSFRLPNGRTWRPCLEPGELPQVEGMVVDADNGVLYAGQEDVGIWRLPARLSSARVGSGRVGSGRVGSGRVGSSNVGSGRLASARPVLVDKVREFGVPGTYDPDTEECTAGPDPGYGGKHLAADVEGLTIYHRAGGRGYLLASSQGDDSFAVYRRDGGNGYLGQFSVTAATGRGIDGAEESDGAAVLNVSLGRRFPKGLLVVQDGDNTPVVTGPDGKPRESTNFKFVRWDDVAAKRPELAVDVAGWDPRRRGSALREPASEK